MKKNKNWEIRKMLEGKQSCKHSKQLSGSHNLRQEKISLSP